MSLKMYGGVAAFVGIGAMVSAADKSMNYIKTPAVVTATTVDCFVKDSNSEIVEKSTGKLAYMDCMMAPLAAQMHNHDASDIKKRVVFEFEYTSPVDGSLQTGEKTMTRDAEKYDEVGETFTLHAHKTEPAKRRF